MISSCFIVKNCEVQQSENQKQLVHSPPIHDIQVETLPYVCPLNVVVNLQELVIDEPLEIELQIFNNRQELIAYTEKNRLIPTKSELKTFCKLQAIHCNEGTFKMILFCNSVPQSEYEYSVECTDEALRLFQLL